ncbi:MAG: WD40 repeat domain-containing protein, partial [Armatimonadota bacterium]
MRRYLSLQFWARVRAVNWILGTAGLVFALFSLLSRHASVQRKQHDEAARQWEQHQLLNWPGRTVSRLAFSPDGRTLVGQGSWIQPGVSLGETRAWDVKTGKRLWTNSHPVSTVLPATFLPGGQTLVSVRADYGATLRNYTPPHVDDYWPSADVRLWLRFRDTRSGRIIADSAP